MQILIRQFVTHSRCIHETCTSQEYQIICQKGTLKWAMDPKQFRNHKDTQVRNKIRRTDYGYNSNSRHVQRSLHRIRLRELEIYVFLMNQSINLFLIKRYIINALSAVQWNSHISLNTYIYIYSEIQHTYKHSYKAAISAQIQCFYFRHTHSHTRGRCERPAPSLFLVIHL